MVIIQMVLILLKNLKCIVTKSFSKIYSLGGLRVGWGYSHSNIIKKLYQVKKPFNVFICRIAIESLKNRFSYKKNGI